MANCEHRRYNFITTLVEKVAGGRSAMAESSP
jgi:hypothetical protein